MARSNELKQFAFYLRTAEKELTDPIATQLMKWGRTNHRKLPVSLKNNIHCLRTFFGTDGNTQKREESSVNYDIYDMIWYDMIWHDTIWYDTIWYMTLYDIKYEIWYAMYLTAIGLKATRWQGGSSTSHIYTQAIHIIQRKENWKVRAVPRHCQFYPGICLTTEKKARKTLS
jgi:hypothetical protein